MAVKVGGWGQGRLKLSSPLHHPYWFWYLSSLSIIHHYVMKNWYVYDSWNIQIAAIMQTPGESIHHPPCLPHSIHVPLTEPLLTIYAWTGQVWSPRSIIALLYNSMFAILYPPPRSWTADSGLATPSVEKSSARSWRMLRIHGNSIMRCQRQCQRSKSQFFYVCGPSDGRELWGSSERVGI